MNRIYYVEDDADIRNLMVYTLNMTGFDAVGFETSEPFLDAMQHKKPDLILLDVMLPGENGFDLLRRLKADPQTMHIPVMMITALGAEDERVHGLDFGADDYIAKPFGVIELIARVRAVMRRCTIENDAAALHAGDICLDKNSHSVKVSGRDVQLTLKEYAILHLLMQAGGHLVERQRLIDHLWNGSQADANHSLDAHMRTLRSKLGEGGSCIQTVYGRGYRLRVPDEK